MTTKPSADQVKRNVEHNLMKLEKLAKAFEFIGNTRTAQTIQAEVTEIRQEIGRLK